MAVLDKEMLFFKDPGFKPKGDKYQGTLQKLVTCYSTKTM